MLEKVIVTVKEGKVQGFKTKTAYSGAEFYSFLGIPYGQPTGGAARYKDPVKVKPWNHILDATVERNGCLQFSLRQKDIVGSENCLYNNIYTPKLPSKGEPLKAVIANVHPGGYFHGSPDPSYYGSPDYIMHKDVVYVCIGHRLHFLGNLNLHMKGCSGSQCLKDLTLSLQWIKENISAFGGDPDNVTLMGSSSGSSLVHFLLLSPLAKGLYHRAILMGLYVFCPLLNFPMDHVAIAYDVAKMIHYDGKPDDHKKLLTFYKNVEFTRLFVTRPEHFFSKTTLQVYPCSPLIPTPEPGENSPLQVPVRELIPSMNRVPIMIGFCEREGCMALALLRNFKRSINDCFPKALGQNDFGWGASLNDDELKQIKKEVENFYLAGESIATASQPTLCDIITDAGLSEAYDSLINVVSADPTSPVYVYNFHYDGKLCMMKAQTERLLEKPLKGAFHGADYSYWNYAEETAGKTMANIQPKDRQTIDTFTSLVTTFAKTDNPNYEGMEVKWEPTTPENPSHLIIDETLRTQEGLLNGERMEFWHKLKDKFGKKC
ncbi:esterase FE4-like [Planococcus citri]|uniref:esterase FE4-like n=1 Tax=Planococcus citri TaxID=170843 RepID=UPI0031F8A597